MRSLLALATFCTTSVAPCLAAQQHAEGTPPVASFEKTETTIATRDEVTLHSNVFVPKEFAGSHPILLVRTPCGIEGGGRAIDESTDTCGWYLELGSLALLPDGPSGRSRGSHSSGPSIESAELR
ncbi:MAG: hypothetical protein ABI442_20880 [Gemmatimonadaceae bacterium]